MYQLPVEKQYVAGLHDQRHRLHPRRKLNRVAGKTHIRIGIDAAQDRYIMRARHHAQAAIVLVTAVNRHPGRDTSSRIHTQVKLILMQRMPARPWRLEVEHRLYGVGFTPQDVGQPVVEALVDHPLHTRFVPAMGLHNSRVQGERIRRIRDVVRIAPMLLVNHQEMLPQVLYFVQRKQTARHGVSLRCELVDGT